MEKPSSIVYQETKDKIATILNECNLPPFVMLDIMKNFTNEIALLSERVYQEDLKKYNEEMKESAE